MKIRESNNDDCEQLYQVHISSINEICSSHYDAQSISGWIATKNVNAYKNLPPSVKIFIAEINKKICGFGVLDIEKKSINGLYIHPNFIGNNIGPMLLARMENLAAAERLDSLELMSTLNAVSFYKRMGYAIEDYDEVKLSSGTILSCVRMKKSFL